MGMLPDFSGDEYKGLFCCGMKFLHYTRKGAGQTTSIFVCEVMDRTKIVTDKKDVIWDSISAFLKFMSPLFFLWFVAVSLIDPAFRKMLLAHISTESYVIILLLAVATIGVAYDLSRVYGMLKERKHLVDAFHAFSRWALAIIVKLLKIWLLLSPVYCLGYAIAYTRFNEITANSIIWILLILAAIGTFVGMIALWFVVERYDRKNNAGINHTLHWVLTTLIVVTGWLALKFGYSKC
jgi:positive regulator of sigma E activity